MIELSKAEAFYGRRFTGRTFDCGSKLGFLTANVAFALDRDDLGGALRRRNPALLDADRP